MVTVGMPVTRPVQIPASAANTPAPTSGNNLQLQIGVGMHNTDFRQPSFDQTFHTLPVQLFSLTATAEYFVP